MPPGEDPLEALDLEAEEPIVIDLDEAVFSLLRKR